MQRLKLISIFTALCFFISCGGPTGDNESPDYQNADTSLVEEFSGIPNEEVQRDLKDIKEDGVIRVITMYSSTNYFLYRGQTMGYEYELIQRLAKDFGLKIELVVVRTIRELVEKLRAGEGDIVAAGMTVTNSRKHYVRFTNALYQTNQVLVQRKPSNWRKLKLHQIEQSLVRDPIHLLGDTVLVRKNSSYFHRLTNLEEELGGNIHIIAVDNMDTEKLISLVEEGEIKYTVADKNLAEVNAVYFPDLDVKTDLSFSQQIAWAVRRTSPNLADTLNIWIEKMKKRNDYYAIYDRYYKSSRSMKKRVESDFFSEKTGKISPYDEIIKKYVEPTGWDWRLVASLVYQESQFNPKAHSWAKASGLMQIMPRTARDLGIKNIHDPNDNIRGGVKYLKQIWDHWEGIEDSTERFKMTFASYNCGMFHVEDARRLAEKEGMNPDVWNENVEVQILNLRFSKYYRDPIVKYGYVRGSEPVKYVREIFERYEDYKRFIPE